MRTNFDVLIIGAGSAGLMSVARLAFLLSSDNRSNDLKIAIVDSNSKAGRKLALTGNGRCNITNLNLNVDLFNSDNSSLVSSIIDDFDSEETISFLESHIGIKTISKESLVYPYTLRSATVVDSLRFYLEDNDVEFIYDAKVQDISVSSGKKYIVSTTNGEFLTDKIIIATGGSSYPNTGSDGASLNWIYKLYKANTNLDKKPDDIFVKPAPALTKLNISNRDLHKLSGYRFQVSIYYDKEPSNIEKGELIVTDTGISGICVMQISSKICRNMIDKTDLTPSVVINFANGMNEEDLNKEISYRINLYPERTICNALSGLFPRVACEFFCKMCGINSETICNKITSRRISMLVDTISKMEFSVSGFGGFDFAQVTSGGIKLNSLNSDLSFKNLPMLDGIYLCGEILNVDGPCGGYNLQWAWSSANRAATALYRGIYENL